MYEIYSFARKLASIIGMNRTTIALAHSMNVMADFINNNTRASKRKVNKTAKTTTQKSALTDDDIEDIDNSISFIHYILTDRTRDLKERIETKFNTLSFLKDRGILTELGYNISEQQFIANDILGIINQNPYPINIEHQLNVIFINKFGRGEEYNNYANIRCAAKRLLKNEIITYKAYYYITQAYKK